MIRTNLRWLGAAVMACNLALMGPGSLLANDKNDKNDHGHGQGDPNDFPTKTPIKHIVVIFQENRSFDHYFGTYPVAQPNLDGSVYFQGAKPNTPSVNGLTPGLLTHNPNSFQPFRLDRSQNLTCDLNHDYTPEQLAFDHGLMDKFPENTSPAAGCPQANLKQYGTGITMGYYDGNTITGLWNYAQFYALNDNHYGTTFGPSTPGALNLVSGQTWGVDKSINTGGDVVSDSVVGDPDPFYDDCSGSEQVGMISTNKNVGDLLNAKQITWGWFEGGFKPTSTSGGKAVCGATQHRLDGVSVASYSPHHEPFQYYASTSNPHHLPPSSVAMIGHTDQANHQYDISDFWNAALAGNLPAVSYLKAPRAQDGHPNNSTSLDEQQFLVNTINALQSLDEWNEIAVVITWDDSDGWYDHQLGQIVNQSSTTADALTGTSSCGTGTNALGGFQGRCGYGPRIPLLVISGWAKKNSVDSTLADFSSILRFIEDNWGLGQIADSFDALAGPLTNMFDFQHFRQNQIFLDPITGEVVAIQDNQQ
ncbi:MAG: alkaline phosphatase family protein [Candidatus Acidiferrales bacterium]